MHSGSTATVPTQSKNRHENAFGLTAKTTPTQSGRTQCTVRFVSERTEKYDAARC